MKKASVKKKSTPAGKTAKKSSGNTPAPLIAKQPASKQAAAVKAGMFLHEDDSWSKSYFDSSDLHCKEREIFG